MRLIPADANLGRMNTKKEIGYRVLTLDRAPFRAFAVATETGIPGHYAAVGGAEAPDEGGYIVWGLRGTDIAEATIEPAIVDSTDALLEGIAAGLDALLTNIKQAMPTMPVIPPFPEIPAPVVQMDTLEFEEEVGLLRAYLIEMVASNNERQTERISELQAQFPTISADVLKQLEEQDKVLARGLQVIGEMRADMTTYFTPPVVVEEIAIPEPVVSKKAKRIKLAVERLDNILERGGA